MSIGTTPSLIPAVETAGSLKVNVCVLATPFTVSCLAMLTSASGVNKDPILRDVISVGEPPVLFCKLLLTVSYETKLETPVTDRHSVVCGVAELSRIERISPFPVACVVGSSNCELSPSPIELTTVDPSTEKSPDTTNDDKFELPTTLSCPPTSTLDCKKEFPLTVS